MTVRWSVAIDGDGPIAQETTEATTHRHRCLRCDQEFVCQTPTICTAQHAVMPVIVRLQNGQPYLTEHCERDSSGQWQAKPEFRISAVAPVEHDDTIKRSFREMHRTLNRVLSMNGVDQRVAGEARAAVDAHIDLVAAARLRTADASRGDQPDDLCFRCGAPRSAAKHQPALIGKVKSAHGFEFIEEASTIARLRADNASLRASHREREQALEAAMKQVAAELRLSLHNPNRRASVAQWAIGTLRAALRTHTTAPEGET